MKITTNDYIFGTCLFVCSFLTVIIIFLNVENTNLRNVIETQDSIINSNVKSQEYIDSIHYETIKLNIDLLNIIDSLNNNLKNKQNEKV